MGIKKLTNGKWRADIQPGGRGGARKQKTFKTKAEALAWVAWETTQHNTNPEWQASRRKDLRKLSELAQLWFDHHGKTLKDGEARLQSLKAAASAMKDPAADKFTPQHFTEYRAERIAKKKSPRTTNLELAYWKAMFNELKRLGLWKKDNPLVGVRAIRVDEQELDYLEADEITALLNVLDGDALLITKICLVTGARWSEAETLESQQVRAGLIQFSETKSSKARAVPISGEIIDALSNKSQGKGTRLFAASYNAFRWAIRKSGIVRRKGQLSHLLRHTFASHFMINGGNIITLQRILGHHSLAMTMRYAHLSPEHLQDAVRLNPLATKRETAKAETVAENGNDSVRLAEDSIET